MLLSNPLLASIVPEVRSAARAGRLTEAERAVEQYRSTNGVTPEYLEAHSWLGRGALQAKNYEAAERYATRTQEMVLELLKTRALDAEKRLPTALGAAIEVQAQAAAATGRRDLAVEFLRQELARYRSTSIHARLRKNLNLLTLEGRPAPRIAGYQAPLRGRPTVLFLWAHWCGDCKSMAPMLERLRRERPDVRLIGPTQLYGYVQGGTDAAPAAEREYIRKMRREFYPMLQAAPVSAANFRVYGASTTPTVVVIDRAGVVRLYHPGAIAYDHLTTVLSTL